MGSDLSQQKVFADFVLADDNANEIPQVRIGAEVGQNGDADSQVKEGCGAFVVYTNNADTTSGDAGASLAERMRVDYQGNVGIGTISPSAKLELKGSTADSTANTFVARDSASASLFSIRNDGRVDATGDLVVGGNLTVNGTTSTINSTTLQVDDKNIELGTVATPTDTTADGGGITLKGATDKTINWVDSTDAWTFSERISIPAGSASAPSLTFSTDTDTGFYNRTAGEINATVNGSWIGAWKSNGLLIYSGTGIFNRLGSAAAPSYTFSGDEDTGIYRSAANRINFSAGGSSRAYIDANGITSSANVYSGDNNQFRNYGGVWKATTGLTGNGFQFISADATALTISSTGDTVASGTVKASSYFLGSSTEISLATTGAGSVFLRPNGQSTSGQMQLASTGNATFAGSVTATDGTFTGDLTVSGEVEFSALNSASASPFVVSDGGTLGTRTAAEVLDDIGGRITKKISGDGTATTFAVTHSFGTPHVMTQLLHYGNNGTGATYEVVNATVKRNSDNAIDVIFGVAPTTSEDYLVLITKMPAIS